MRKRFVRRGLRPSRTWYDVSAAWAHSAITSTTSTNLINLQSPAATVNLSSDPVQDLTLLRLVGDFAVSISSTATADWTLAVLVQDLTWTPSATFALDADKRILWHQTYRVNGSLAGSTAMQWEPPGQLLYGATVPLVTEANREAVHIDIAPKVKIQPGQGLVLVAYENTGAQAFTTSSVDMRLLFQRTGR